MTLQLFHPGVAKIRCADCLKRAYNMETGEPQTYSSGPDKELKYYDGPNHKAPCQTKQTWQCPKGDPSREADFVLIKKNHLAILLWQHVRSTHGQILADSNVDRLMADNLAILDGLYRAKERAMASRDSADGMVMSLVPFLRR